MGCHIRLDLETGARENTNYMNSRSWVMREIAYGHEKLRLKPADIPRHSGHKDAAAHDWSGNTSSCAAVGCRSANELSEIAVGIANVTKLRYDHGSWSVRASKTFSGVLKHNDRFALRNFMVLRLEELQKIQQQSWQKHRKAIHFAHAGGDVSPGPGTVVKYGPYMFYAKLDVESLFAHGHELYLTDNGVVVSCQEDPDGLRYEKKQQEARVGSSLPTRRQVSPQGEAGDTVHGNDPLVKITPWNSLPKATRKLLGGNYEWASWMTHPLSGYGIHPESL
ncbi:GIP [Symbiodinium sp. CCMP2456]|nr:GIP [Symbiodinium sp. CCMP2456]